MLNSIRNRLLVWFIVFMLLIAGILVPVNLAFNNKEKHISSVADRINSLNIAFLRDSKNINNFLSLESANQDFFTEGKSSYLVRHQEQSKDLSTFLQQIRTSGETAKLGISADLAFLDNKMNRYNAVFDSLVYLVYKRGYRNFGLQGELADYASMLERAPGLTNKDILRLRNIENYYFQNKDTAAVKAMQNQLAYLGDKISRNSKLSVLEKNRTMSLVSNYTGSFMRVVDIDRLSGLDRNIALRAQLDKLGAEIEKSFNTISSKTASAQKVILARLSMFYIISVILVFALALGLSLHATRYIASHIEALTSYISAMSTNDADSNHAPDLQNSAKEIKQIYGEFRNLFSQLKIWEKQRDNAMRNADDNQQRYRELADMLPQSVFETDVYGNYSYVNKAWYQAFGYSERELNDGLNLIETLVSENAEDILGISKIENSTFSAIRKNNSRFPVSVYTDNIIRNGKIAGKRGIIVDITDKVNYIKTLQQETSKAKSSDELKSSFLANMSHEIRTPMNSIIGFSNLLASEQIPEVQKKDFTQYIQTSSEILLNLVDDIIDIAKIEAGELKIVKKDCNLNALCAELLNTSLETRNKFNKQHIALSFLQDDPSSSDVFLKTDPFRLRQVLVNLINNAIKFTDKGFVEFGYHIKEETLIEFYVKDTGPGMSREELNMIFERFKRARTSEEKNIVGTGLGLAISKNLVQLLGGEMWVDSIAGTGTTFVFTIPYLKPTILPEHRQISAQPEVQYNWNGRKVLIAEDDQISFRFLNELLRKTQVEIIHASNGKKAVDVVKSGERLDLVIMDIQLPVMDGLQATRLIKTMNPDLPVIAQTAYAMAGDNEKIRQAGCDDYVPKPLDASTLMAVMDRYLKTTETSAENRSRIISN
ncbi:MAG TPA: ATP-binding protein [Bacteroidales bacterium]|nr:ATP-binding protein [Bacteroidales bacterium]